MSGSARTGIHHVIASVVLIGTTLVGGAAVAQTSELGTGIKPGDETPHLIELHGGLAYSDNVRRVSSGEEGDTLASVGLGIDYGFAGSRVTAAARGNLDYVEYLQNTYGGTLAGNIDAQLVWGQKSDVLQWMIEDTFGQTRSNALAGATPDNLQNVNVLSTGPSLNFRFDQTTFTLDGRYADQSYESGNFDSKRYTGAGHVERELSPVSNISLNAQLDKTRFDDDVTNTDYETRQYYLRYRSNLGRMGVIADAGYTDVELDNAGDKNGSPLVRLDLDRRISGSSSLFLGGSIQFLSSADAIRGDANRAVALAGDDSDPLSASDPFREREVHGGWRFDHSRTSFSITGTYATERYKQSTELDRDTWGARISATRHIAPTVWLRGEASWDKQSYDNLAASTRDTVFSAELTKDLGTKLSATLRYEHNDRAGTGAAIDYTENVIALYIRFAALGR
ncbi:MAG: hypothetical protein WDO68_20660 [Gammaproteobacteria bacterium]